jgi:hypothetical protein
VGARGPPAPEKEGFVLNANELFMLLYIFNRLTPGLRVRTM